MHTTASANKRIEITVIPEISSRENYTSSTLPRRRRGIPTAHRLTILRRARRARAAVLWDDIKSNFYSNSCSSPRDRHARAHVLLLQLSNSISNSLRLSQFLKHETRWDLSICCSEHESTPGTVTEFKSTATPFTDHHLTKVLIHHKQLFTALKLWLQFFLESEPFLSHFERIEPRWNAGSQQVEAEGTHSPRVQLGTKTEPNLRLLRHHSVRVVTSSQSELATRPSPASGFLGFQALREFPTFGRWFSNYWLTQFLHRDRWSLVKAAWFPSMVGHKRSHVERGKSTCQGCQFSTGDSQIHSSQ